MTHKFKFHLTFLLFFYLFYESSKTPQILTITETSAHEKSANLFHPRFGLHDTTVWLIRYIQTSFALIASQNLIILPPFSQADPTSGTSDVQKQMLRQPS